MKEKLKKLMWYWIKFWGKRFWIYKDNKEVNEILIYKHKIYILGSKELT